MKKIKKNEKFYSSLDLFAATAFFYITNGIVFPGHDNISNIPRVFKLLSPELYQSDFVLNTFPGTYPYFYFLSFFSGLIGVTATYLILNVLSHILLLYGIRKLVQVVFGVKTYAVVIELFLILLAQQTGMGHYYLSFNAFSPHYLSLGFSTLALVYFLQSRFIVGVGMMAAAIYFHIILGFHGLILLAPIIFQKINNRKIVTGSLILGGVITVLMGVLFIYLKPEVYEAMNQTARLVTYVIAPFHVLIGPLEGTIVENFIYLSLFFLLFRWNSTPKIFALKCAALIYTCLIFLHVVNSATLFNPLVFFVNSSESSPLLYMLFIVFAAGIISTHWSKKRYVLALAPLIVWSLQGKIILLALGLVATRLGLDKAKRPGLLAGVIFTGILVAQHFLARYGLVQYTVTPIGWYFIPLLIGLGQDWQLDKKGTPVPRLAIGLFAFALLSHIMVNQHSSFLKNALNTTEEWDEVCEFAKNNTPVNSGFVIPPWKKDFQYCSQRSAFFNQKRFPSNPKDFLEWFRRGQRVKLFDSKLHPSRLTKKIRRNYDGYHSLTNLDYLNIRNSYPEFDHCIVKRGSLDGQFKTIFQNNRYSIYRITQG